VAEDNNTPEDQTDAQEVPDTEEETSQSPEPLDPMQEAERQAERYLANWQRTQADFANYKKRIEQEQADFCKYASAKLMVNLLPVIDDFERALESKPAEVEEQPWIEGLVLIHRKLKSLLEAEGVEEIQALGEDFDPALHEAIMQAPGEEGKVVQEIQKGYKVDDRVIRPAMVVVGNGHAAGNEN
jgi:molecular chaperone GrpE